MECGLVSHRFQSVGASGTRYSLVPLRPQVSPEEQERGEQWKGFAGEIRREIRLAQTQQKHMEEIFTAKLTHIEKTTAANFSRIEETTAANFSRIEAQLERLVKAYPKTAQPEGS